MAGALSVALGGARRMGRLPPALEPLMGGLLGWTATLLFMFQPLAQLVRGAGLFAMPYSRNSATNPFEPSFIMCRHFYVMACNGSSGAGEALDSCPKP